MSELLGSFGGQITIALVLLGAIAAITYRTTTRGQARHDGSAKDVFLASGGLKWMFVAGSITLTNLSTEQLVGMNGNQMFLLAWWELAGFAGLMMLAFVFVPIYYRTKCTTVTELLEQRYGGGSIRTLISALFLIGNILIYLPAALYSVDFHTKFVRPVTDHWRLAAIVSVVLTITSILMVPAFENAKSIINLLQQLNGLSSMPILSAFIVALLFRNVAAGSAIAGVIWGVVLYGLFSFVWSPAGIITMHYIDFMVVTLATSVLFALSFNRLVLGRRAQFSGLSLLRGGT